MEIVENYVYKKEVDWSLLTEGLTLPIDNQVIFSRNMGKFLSKGDSKEITLFLEGKAYKAQIRNVNFNTQRYNRKDILQIRYKRDGELANALKVIYVQSYNYIVEMRDSREQGERKQIRLPESCKEYLAIYTTTNEDSYLLETIVANDLYILKDAVRQKTERIMESGFNYDIIDDGATIFEDKCIMKIRKLNRAIGDNLKLLYTYRCQICGKSIGQDYGSHVVEAHHIDYFIHSFNNDSNNQLIVCPNHHSIIHDVNPVFNLNKLKYEYPNGLIEGLKLNIHLKNNILVE